MDHQGRLCSRCAYIRCSRLGACDLLTAFDGGCGLCWQRSPKAGCMAGMHTAGAMKLLAAVGGDCGLPFNRSPTGAGRARCAIPMHGAGAVSLKYFRQRSGGVAFIWVYVADRAGTRVKIAAQHSNMNFASPGAQLHKTSMSATQQTLCGEG
jgi:hypothetical protein